MLVTEAGHLVDRVLVHVVQDAGPQLGRELGHNVLLIAPDLLQRDVMIEAADPIGQLLGDASLLHQGRDREGQVVSSRMGNNF